MVPKAVRGARAAGAFTSCLSPLRRRTSGARAPAQALPRTARGLYSGTAGDGPGASGHGPEAALGLSACLAAGVIRSGAVRSRGVWPSARSRAQWVSDPAPRSREDGGPEQCHRRRCVRGPLHRVLHLLRPQETE